MDAVFTLSEGKIVSQAPVSGSSGTAFTYTYDNRNRIIRIDYARRNENGDTDGYPGNYQIEWEGQNIKRIVDEDSESKTVDTYEYSELRSMSPIVAYANPFSSLSVDEFLLATGFYGNSACYNLIASKRRSYRDYGTDPGDAGDSYSSSKTYDYTVDEQGYVARAMSKDGNEYYIYEYIWE